jgi:hypothetical protein
MRRRTDGDRLFESDLRHVGIAVPEHEPNLGIGARIEYLLDVGGQRCVTEVKEFAPSSTPITRSGTYSPEQLLKPHRNQIDAAAEKLKKAKDLGYPLVVVLTDPHQAVSAVGLLAPEWIVAAMMGETEASQPLSPRDPAGVASFGAGRNGELPNEHSYVSAVTVIYTAHPPRANTFITTHH